jgi:polyferredoxin
MARTVTLGIYYLLPFVRWDRGPDAPSQAVLVDFPQPPLLFLLHRNLAAGGLLLHRPARPRRAGLFLMNAVAGRIWCGYLCPQTVWTDLFYAVERWIEGDRRERMKKDAGPGPAARPARWSRSIFSG